jgi:hypothetical protein
VEGARGGGCAGALRSLGPFLRLGHAYFRHSREGFAVWSAFPDEAHPKPRQEEEA